VTAADEVAHIRDDHRRALDQLAAATTARVTALEEARDTLRVRAERAEADLDAARADNKRLAEKLAEAASADAEKTPAGTAEPLPRTSTRAKKAPVTRTPHPKA
jgi:hypothetical protein